MTSQTLPQGATPSAAPRALTRGDYKTLGLSALGGTLEFYDFVVFVFFANVIGSLFFPATMPDWLRQLQTLGIFAAGYLARPLGGILIAHFGDILGRKKMFTLSVFLMAVPTLVIGLLPTYESIGIAAPILLLLAFFDLFMIILIGHEYKTLKARKADRLPLAAPVRPDGA